MKRPGRSKNVRLGVDAGGQPVVTVRPRVPGQAEAFSTAETGQDNWTTAASQQLRAFVERVERLEDEKAAIAEDIKEVFAESKSNGFDIKILRQVLRLRRQDRDERMEEEAVLDLYKQVLGMA